MPGLVVDDDQAKAVGQWKVSQYSRRYIGTGYRHDDNAGKGTKTLTFVPEITKAGQYEVRLAYSPGAHRADCSARSTIFSADGENTIHVNMRKSPQIDARFISLGNYNFEANGQGFVILSNEGTDGHVTADAVQFIPVETTDKLLKAATAKFSGKLPDEAQQAAADCEAWKKTWPRHAKLGPKRPTVMSVEEERPIEDVAICVRGNVHNAGDQVPRGLLAGCLLRCAGRNAQQRKRPAATGPWLASPRNPLPARVMVNRIWHWLFGAGLVRTTDNFGARPAKHPRIPSCSITWLLGLRMRIGPSSARARDRALANVPAGLAADGSKAQARLLKADPENRLLRRIEPAPARCRVHSRCHALRERPAGSDHRRLDHPTGKNLRLRFRQHSEPAQRLSARAAQRLAGSVRASFDFADPSIVTGAQREHGRRPGAVYDEPSLCLPAGGAGRQAIAGRSAQHAGDEQAGESKHAGEQIKQAFLRTLGRLPTPAELKRTEAYLRELLSGPRPSNRSRPGAGSCRSYLLRSISAT